MKKYKLGEYEFDTYEELLAAEEDTKKIDVTIAMKGSILPGLTA